MALNKTQLKSLLQQSLQITNVDVRNQLLFRIFAEIIDAIPDAGSVGANPVVKTITIGAGDVSGVTDADFADCTKVLVFVGGVFNADVTFTTGTGEFAWTIAEGEDVTIFGV